jgi:CBS domain-containing protein
VIVVGPEMPIRDVIHTLVERRISGVPVVGTDGRVVGVISEGDLILRERALRPRTGMAYLAQQLFEDHARLAEEYRKAHGMTAEQVMTREVFTCNPGTPVEEIAHLMAERHIKRVPVVENDRLVGLVSRADVLRAAAHRIRTFGDLPLAGRLPDEEIRVALLGALRREPWAEVDLLEVEVQQGVVTLSGQAESEQEREAIGLAARSIPGVREVVNNLAVDPRATRED